MSYSSFTKKEKAALYRLAVQIEHEGGLQGLFKGCDNWAPYMDSLPFEFSQELSELMSKFDKFEKRIYEGYLYAEEFDEVEAGLDD
jgi:hypothetical protein